MANLTNKQVINIKRAVKEDKALPLVIAVVIKSLCEDLLEERSKKNGKSS
jgi:hypothetical protein